VIRNTIPHPLIPKAAFDVLNQRLNALIAAG
jgi:hypothetical protein